MALSVGIVGLPNVGKSTLFNAITNASVEAENYPFCTIEPNVGIVPVRDIRLEGLAKMSQSQKILPATIEFVDIAGLVRGASKGEGLGNQFLTNIRETSVIAQVVRCFEDPNVVHVHGKVSPKEDIEVIELELLLSDLERAQKLVSTQQKKTKAGNAEETEKLRLYEKIESNLKQEIPLRRVSFTEDEKKHLKGLSFLTHKKVIYVANVSESDLGSEIPPLAMEVQSIAEKHGDSCIVLSAKFEEDLSKVASEEREDYLQAFGLTYCGLDLLSQASFRLLGLQTYLTTGPKETRAWIIPVGATAPQAAGVIHTDFEKGFIRANTVSYTDLLTCGGLKQAREKGLLRQEGKDYRMQDGDVVEFLFNV